MSGITGHGQVQSTESVTTPTEPDATVTSHTSAPAGPPDRRLSGEGRMSLLSRMTATHGGCPPGFTHNMRPTEIHAAIDHDKAELKSVHHDMTAWRDWQHHVHADLGKNKDALKHIDAQIADVKKQIDAAHQAHPGGPEEKRLKSELRHLEAREKVAKAQVHDLSAQDKDAKKQLDALKDKEKQLQAELKWLHSESKREQDRKEGQRKDEVKADHLKKRYAKEDLQKAEHAAEQADEAQAASEAAQAARLADERLKA